MIDHSALDEPIARNPIAACPFGLPRMGGMSPDDRLPDDLSFDDFLAALDRIDAPEDVDLPSDWDGCVLVASMPVTEVAAAVSKLQQAEIQAHTELPEGEEIGRGDTGSVFVPFADLGRARAVLRLES
jgi:hypothetical protein